MKILFALCAAMATLAPSISFCEITHPLDALDAAEIAQSVALLRAGGHADDRSAILSLTLDLPNKADVLRWKAGESFSRKSIATIRRVGKTQDILIDLVKGEVARVSDVAGTGQPSLVLPEIFDAIDIVLADAEMQAGLA